ncbi:BCCT family transporter [Agrococcus sp. KRD186]|uniref:BCCT family transporter n=1 Tax=Agrococcus sp. KRD186 TaxID=2729730 RepID=UPI00406C1813
MVVPRRHHQAHLPADLRRRKRFGRRRLGADADRPEFSTWAWLAMILSAVLGCHRGHARHTDSVTVIDARLCVPSQPGGRLLHCVSSHKLRAAHRAE